MRKAGLYIMILGLVLTVFTAVTFFTRERIAKVGDIKISINKPHHFKWSPLVGVGIILCGGIVFLSFPVKSK